VLPRLEAIAADKDPFDRLLLCQSLEYDLIIMTEDTAIISYPLAKIF
jgi:PIN domain nuclease of toxin-antitoxin system